MSLDVSSLAAIQDRYREVKEGFYTKTFVDPAIADMMQVTAKDGVILQSASITGGLQSYQAGHHAKGQVVLTGRELTMSPVKLDMTFEPQALTVEHYKSYLKRSGNDPRVFIYEDFVLQMIMNKMYEDFKVEVLWGGMKLATIAGAPNNAQDTANGFLHLLRTAVWAGEIAPTITGQITSSNAVDKLRQFVRDNLDKPGVRRRPHFLYCAQKTVDAYQEDYEDTRGTDTHADNPWGLTMIHGTNTYLVPQDGLEGNELILTRPDNLHVGFDGAPNINLDLIHRLLYVEIDWKYGMQFQSAIELEVNEWI